MATFGLPFLYLKLKYGTLHLVPVCYNLLKSTYGNDMTRIQFAYIKEGPSDSVSHFYERWQNEMRIYAMITKFENMGLNVIRASDGKPFPGQYYFLEFESEAEAALFKLTHL